MLFGKINKFSIGDHLKNSWCGAYVSKNKISEPTTYIFVYYFTASSSVCVIIKSKIYQLLMDLTLRPVFEHEWNLSLICFSRIILWELRSIYAIYRFIQTLTQTKLDNSSCQRLTYTDDFSYLVMLDIPEELIMLIQTSVQNLRAKSQ